MSQALLFTTTKCADANPKIVQAAKMAVHEASEMIRTDPAGAIRRYRKQSGDTLSEDALLDVLKQPGMDDFNDVPQGTMAFAKHLYDTGVLKTEPRSWKDYFLPIAHDLDGS